MRLSEFAQDVLLDVIYRLQEIEPDELTTAEKNILETAQLYDRTIPVTAHRCSNACGDDGCGQDGRRVLQP